MSTEGARDRAAKLARKILKLPEDPVPVISTADCIPSFSGSSFVTAVRLFILPLPHHPLLIALPDDCLR